jgi:hypothetical protein
MELCHASMRPDCFFMPLRKVSRDSIIFPRFDGQTAQGRKISTPRGRYSRPPMYESNMVDQGEIAPPHERARVSAWRSPRWGVNIRTYSMSMEAVVRATWAWLIVHWPSPRNDMCARGWTGLAIALCLRPRRGAASSRAALCPGAI